MQDPFEGPRYPGSLVVGYAKNRAQQWAERYRAPDRAPGRLQLARAWLLPRVLRVEGLVLGGAALLALAGMGAKVYMSERVEDLRM